MNKIIMNFLPQFEELVNVKKMFWVSLHSFKCYHFQIITNGYANLNYGFAE